MNKNTKRLLVGVVLVILCIICVSCVSALMSSVEDSNAQETTEHFGIAKTSSLKEYLEIREELREQQYIILNEAVVSHDDKLIFVIEWELEQDPFNDDENSGWGDYAEEPDANEDEEEEWGEEIPNPYIYGDGDGIPARPKVEELRFLYFWFIFLYLYVFLLIF